jgi:hypothetical protein
MGYSLTIGELEIRYDNDIEVPRIRLTASSTRLDAAPAFGEPTDFTNERWPSYSSWTEFCRNVGLRSLFYGDDDREDCLLENHPGCVPLTKKHVAEINDAMNAYKLLHPDAIPTYGNPKNFYEADPDNSEENSFMCRLVWLQFWATWAINNCEKPVFANS